MSALPSVLWAAYFFISSAVFVCMAALIMVTTAWFDKNRRLVHQFACLWGYHYLLTNPGWRCTWEGRELIDPKKTYVFVVNHQSYWDILVVYGLFREFKWVAKEEIFKMPFVGWNMMLNQYVTISRGNLSSIKEMMKTCKNWLKRGASIMMFPEGTRSEDGEIHPFRDGAFKMAADCNVEVVPIVIDGTLSIGRKYGKRIKFVQPIHVKILPPVDPARFNGVSTKTCDHVHGLMVDALAEMRGEESAVLI